MPNYQRVYIKGSTIFITLVTYNRAPLFTDPGARKILHNVWKDTTRKFPFTTVAVCLLPDHLHTLITMPKDEDNYSMRIREIKRRFTNYYLVRYGKQAERNSSRQTKKEAAIWQRRFWEHTIRDERDFENHFHYIHFNPVKHGLVEKVTDWKWSSFHRFVRSGVYEKDWGRRYEQKGQEFGE